MRWQMGRRSENIEDRRGMSSGRIGRGGGVGGLGVLAIALVAMFLGVDPSIILNGLSPDGGQRAAPSRAGGPPANDQDTQFVSAVLAQTEDTWGDIFSKAGETYQKPTLVLFSDRAIGMRHGRLGYRPLLLPGRPEGLSGHRLFRGARPAVRRPRRLRPRLCDRPRGRATTSRTCSASRARFPGCSNSPTSQRPTGCR